MATMSLVIIKICQQSDVAVVVGVVDKSFESFHNVREDYYTYQAGSKDFP